MSSRRSKKGSPARAGEEPTESFASSAVRPISAPPVRRRKPESEQKTETLKLLVTAAERIKLEAMAEKERLSLSTWLRLVALRAAEQADG